MDFPNVINKFSGESFGVDNIRTVYAGDEDTNKDQPERTVLLIGPSGAQKDKLIDFICNVVYGVNFESDHRYRIANTRFDSTTPQKRITKYVFYGTRFSYRPVVIDTPDIQDSNGIQVSSELNTVLTNFLYHDTGAEIHAICLVLPSNSNCLPSQTLMELQKTLSLFPPRMKENIVVLVTFAGDSGDETYSALRQLGYSTFRKYFVYLNYLFSKVSTVCLDQKREWETSVQNLSLFLLHVGRLNPKTMENSVFRRSEKPPLGPRTRPGSSVNSRGLIIPQTIPEVKEDSLCSTPTTNVSVEIQPIVQKNQKISSSSTLPIISLKKPRPASFNEADDRQNLRSRALKETYSSTSRLNMTQPSSKQIIFGSQPLGPEVIPVEDHLLPLNNDKENYVQIKRYLYDPTTRTYQMYYVRERSPNTFSGSHPTSNSPVPRVISPVLGSTKTEIEKEVARIIRASVEALEQVPSTDDSGSNSGIFTKGESARSTASEWKYTPSSQMSVEKQIQSTFIGSGNRPQNMASGRDYGNTTFGTEPMVLNTQGYFEPKPPPKPARAVDPEFLETGEEQVRFLRSQQQRKTRRNMSNSQRRTVKSHPVVGNYEADFDSDIESGTVPNGYGKITKKKDQQMNLLVYPCPPPYETHPRPRPPVRRPVRNGPLPPQRRRRQRDKMKSSSKPAVPKLQMELLEQENDESNDVQQFYQLTEESVAAFIEDLLVVQMSWKQRSFDDFWKSSDDNQSKSSLSSRSFTLARAKSPRSVKLYSSLTNISNHETSLPPKSPRTVFADHVTNQSLPLYYILQVASNPLMNGSRPEPRNGGRHFLPEQGRQYPVDVFNLDFVPIQREEYRSGRASVPAHLFSKQENDYYYPPQAARPIQNPKPQFAEVAEFDNLNRRPNQLSSNGSTVPWRQQNSINHQQPPDLREQFRSIASQSNRVIDELLAPYSLVSPPQQEINNSPPRPPARNPQPYYPYRRPNSALADPFAYANQGPNSRRIDPLRQQNKEQIPSVALHIKNPFVSSPEQDNIRPTHRTFSEPNGHQGIHTLDILSTSLYDPTSPYYSARDSGFNNNFIDKTKVYFSDTDEFEDDEMSKTTPNWRNNFTQVRERFGAKEKTPVPEDALPYAHDFSFASDGSLTMPRNRGLLKSASQTTVTSGRLEPSRSSSLLREAVNRRAETPVLEFRRKSETPEPKKGLGNFWLETVKNRASSPSPQKVPFKMTAAERLEQLHEPIDGPNNGDHLNPNLYNNGVQQNFNSNQSQGVNMTFRRIGADSVAQRKMHFIQEEKVNANNAASGSKLFPSERFISERKSVNGNNNSAHANAFSSLDHAVADLKQNTEKLIDSRGCAKFPIGEFTTSPPVKRLSIFTGTRISPPRNVNQHNFNRQHSPSPDSLSGESNASLANLPHPRPKHNIREQLMNAGVGNTYLGPYMGRRSGTPNFPTPSSGSVASKISAFEKRPGTPTLQLAVGNFNNTPEAPKSPLSPITTIFRTKPVIHVDMGNDARERPGSISPEYDNKRISTVSTSAAFHFSNKGDKEMMRKPLLTC